MSITNKRPNDLSPEIETHITKYHRTDTEDVLIAENIEIEPDIHTIQEQLQDPKLPIHIVITGDTRDKFLEYIKTVTDKPTPKVTNTSTSNDDVFEDEIDENFLRTNFRQITKQLEEIEAEFPNSKLLENLPCEEDFNTFRNVRRALTHLFVSCTKNTTAFQKMKEETDYLCKTELHFIPNKLKREHITQAMNTIQQAVTKANKKLLYHTTYQNMQLLEDFQGTIMNTPHIILAKAWRTVRKSQALYNNEHSHRPRTYADTEHTHKPRTYADAVKTNTTYRQQQERPTHLEKPQHTRQPHRRESGNEQRQERRDYIPHQTTYYRNRSDREDEYRTEHEHRPDRHDYKTRPKTSHIARHEDEDRTDREYAPRWNSRPYRQDYRYQQEDNRDDRRRQHYFNRPQRNNYGSYRNFLN